LHALFLYFGTHQITFDNRDFIVEKLMKETDQNIYITNTLIILTNKKRPPFQTAFLI